MRIPSEVMGSLRARGTERNQSRTDYYRTTTSVVDGETICNTARRIQAFSVCLHLLCGRQPRNESSIQAGGVRAA